MAFNSNSPKSSRSRVVCGVGLNDADYPVAWREKSEDGKVIQKYCPFYIKWKNLLRRCFVADKRREVNTYEGVTVCEEWLTFSNFKRWMEQQDWEGKCLDKDILFPGNKVYSPETCVFVDNLTNCFMHEPVKHSKFPIGVSWNGSRSKFSAQCNPLGGNGSKHLGLFSTIEEAHQRWLEEKKKQAKILASRQSDPRVAKAILDRYENYKQGEY